MSPYLLPIGVPLLILVLGWIFIRYNRREDKTTGGVEKLAATVEVERRERAREVEQDAKATAIGLASENKKLVERVDLLERDTQRDVGVIRTGLAVLTERMRRIFTNNRG